MSVAKTVILLIYAALILAALLARGQLATYSAYTLGVLALAHLLQAGLYFTAAGKRAVRCLCTC
ncbi:hypothetical protein E2F43_09155 [Seongchinamella unica]|uniref:Uncharacterized protein n=1 Tax=Seongchinamella unica TaxID=2547392 RepID=A0A4R5LS11_9GAMM|nr:hypothetical protein [Seongchinamella unica]TDG13679.1 hypothetical protein E2F43_09155 [Seongchinamella unica]